MCEFDWFHLLDNAPSHKAETVKEILLERNVTMLDHSPLLSALDPAKNFYPKVKTQLEWVCVCVLQSEIHKAVTSTLNIIAKKDFYGGIQTLYDRANWLVQLEGIFIE